ncbi:MAG: PqqD family protein [Chloroflexota bacterium]
MVPQVQAKLTTSRCVAFAEFGDEAVLLNTETGVYFGLNGVGTQIWELLSQGLTVDQMYEQLLDSYAVDPEGLREDIEHFLRLLQDRGLVVQGPVA